MSAALDVLFPSVCAGCGATGSAFCALCRRTHGVVQRRSCAGLRVLSAGTYDGALRRAILAYKRGRRDVGQALGEWLAERCGPLGEDAVIVPVPTTAQRRAERGFDQSVLLARALGHAERPVLVALRHRAGDAQRGRSRSKRLAATDRFECTAPQLVARVTCVLVDDVVTTGATLADSARTLRAHGAFVNAAITLASAQ